MSRESANANAPALCLVLVLVLVSSCLRTSQAQASEKITKLNLRDRVLYVGNGTWHFRTRWYDVVPVRKGVFAFIDQKSSKYFEFSRIDELPRWLVIPINYRPYIKGEAWKKERTGKLHGIPVTVYKRNVKIETRDVSDALGQIGRNMSASKRKRSGRFIVGTEHLWVTSSFGHTPSLSRFINVYFGCTDKLGLPVKNTLNFQDCPKNLTRRLLSLTGSTTGKTIRGYGKLPAGAKKTTDFIQVMAGSGDGVLEFLYQDRSLRKQNNKKEKKD